MKNLTITVDDSVLEWARVEAARRGTSVSRMVGDFMAELMQREDAYERAYLAWRTDERSWQADATGQAGAVNHVSKNSENIAHRATVKRSGGQKSMNSGALA